MQCDFNEVGPLLTISDKCSKYVQEVFTEMVRMRFAGAFRLVSDEIPLVFVFRLYWG